MKTKALLIPFVAVLTVMIVGLASALTGPLTVTFNDVTLPANGDAVATITSDTVPVRVIFTADENASDVRIKVSMEGFRDDVSASTSRFNLVDGSTYSKLVSLEMPADIRDLTKDVTLYVSVSSATDKVEEDYTVRLQRESYDFSLVSVDYPLKASAGETIPVSVVVENIGMERLDDAFVTVSIPALSISSKVYLGDTVAVECEDDCNKEDSVQRILYLKIPENANAGVYELVTKAYNRDAAVTASKLISIEESPDVTVISALKNQDIRAGETKTYDLIIVNSANNIKVFTIQAVSGTALSVSAPSVVTVPAGSSTTVPVSVTASSDADVGSYTFTVIVDGKQTTFGANVVEGKVSTSVVALTAILVIIFVILLVVLIVLLTRKEKPVEEVETSYY